MAKALLGYLPTDLRTLDQVAADNAKLRARVADLTELVGALKAENDTLVARVAELVDATLDDLQPA